MKKKVLLTVATGITSIAFGTTIYLSQQPNLTETETQLLNTANTITLTGSAAIFGLLDDDDE